MKEIPSQVSESVRRKNPHLYGEAYAKEFCTPKPAKRIRQSSKPLLNKLEQEWLATQGHIRYCGMGRMYGQLVKFKLGNGVFYCPDVVCFKSATCWEIKGSQPLQDDSVVKIKVAASTFPDILWILTWKEHGQWKEQIVLP